VKPEGIPLRLLDAWSCAGTDHSPPLPSVAEVVRRQQPLADESLRPSLRVPAEEGVHGSWRRHQGL